MHVLGYKYEEIARHLGAAPWDGKEPHLLCQETVARDAKGFQVLRGIIHLFIFFFQCEDLANICNK